MKVVIRFSAKEEAKALPVILRGSPYVILRNRTYILGEEIVKKLVAAKIKFREVSRESITRAEGALSGERI